MQIITYSTSDPGVHPAYACAAIVLYDDGTRAPIMFTARTEDIARAAAQGWWDSELERVREKYQGSDTPMARRPRRKRRDEVGAAPEPAAVPAVPAMPDFEEEF
jgi:hypothetical protein